MVSWVKTVLSILIITALLLSGGYLLERQVTAADAEELDLPPIELPEKGNPKLDSHLYRLVSAGTPQKAAGFAQENRIETVGDRVRVVVECLPGQLEAATGAAVSLGAVETSYGSLLQVLVLVSELAALADAPGIRFVRLPYEPLPEVVSEGVAVINANEWHTAGYTGDGVKIAILDMGFAGYTTRQSEGELPATVATWWAPSLGGPGESAHGTACAEIAYDVAPGAQLYLANFGTEVEMGNAVDWLIDQGVDVISHSVGWPIGGPGDGTGVICDMVDSAGAAGIFWAQAVGNSAQRHWQGDFVNTDGDQYHEFSVDDEGNTILVNDGEVITIGLKWDDSWGASANDYDLLLFDSGGGLPVAGSTDIQDGDDDPTELLSYTAEYDGVYTIAIGTLGTPAVVNFHLYSYNHNLEYQTAASSFSVPADAASATAAGAVYWDTPATLEPFSSRGPTKDGRIKPDLVAPDGVSTASYGAQAFSGTSASAPHVAGAAALVKERLPAYTPAQTQSYLEGQAADLGDAGKDNLYGSGRLDLGDANTAPALSEGSVSPASGDVTTSFTYTVNYTDADDDPPVSITVAIDGGTPASMTVKAGEDGDYTNGEIFEYTLSGLTDGSHTFQFAASDLNGNATGDIGVHAGPLISNDNWWIKVVDDGGGEAWVGFQTSIAVDNSNNAYIAYGDNTNDTIKYAFWNGSTWQIETIEQSSIKTNLGPSIALDSNRYPHIAYIIPTGVSTNELRHTRWNGSSWQIETITTDAHTPTSIAIDASNDVHIAYLNQTCTSLEYARWNGGTWQVGVVDSATSMSHVSLALDSSGNPHIAYNAGHSLKYARWDGATWVRETIDGPGGSDIGLDASIALDSTDKPHMVYYNGVTKTMNYAHWDGTTWQKEVVANMGVGYFGLYSDITIDGSDTPHITYFQNALKYAYWTGSA